MGGGRGKEERGRERGGRKGERECVCHGPGAVPAPALVYET